MPLTVDFLKANRGLPVDTAHLPKARTQALISRMENLDETLDALLVHGHNDAAVRLLRNRYQGVVKCLYADPPFNTSEVGFIYKNEYRHSSWCTMMANLLDASQPLLQEQGVLACAIDDCEVYHLGLVCDEVFGSDNRLGILVVEIKPSGRTNDNFLATSHEYYLIYGPDPSGTEIGFFTLTEEQQEAYEHQDDQGAFKWRDFLRTGGYSTPEERPNSHYPIYYRADAARIGLEPFEGADEIWPIDSEGRRRVWRKTPPSFLKHLAAGEIRIAKNRSDIWKVQIIDRIKPGTRPKSVWVGKYYDASSHGTKLLKAMFGEAGAFTFPKSLYSTKDVVHIAAGNDDAALVLDYFAGSGTTGHAVINSTARTKEQRKFILVESWRSTSIRCCYLASRRSHSRPSGRTASRRLAKRKPSAARGSSRYIRLESYEDTLNNLETRRTPTQQLLLEAAEAQGADGLKEQYLLRYMLDVETRGSQSLLNVQAFNDPTAYKLKVKRPGSDESRELNVDLLETFNYLVGLTVQHIAAPQSFTAEFERDSEKRLRLKGRLKQDTSPMTIAVVVPHRHRHHARRSDARSIIWRKLTGDPEQDNLVLDEWFTKQGYSTKDYEFQLIYVNGDNNLENLKAPDDTWKVRLIEEDFHRLMFDTEGV